MSATTPPARTLAVVTMVYNEPDFVPIWLRYYGGQVGLQNCFVVDHGSDDGSTDDLGGASKTRLPRTPFDIQQKVNFISQFCSSLLNYYDFVAYTDVDEILVADPRYHASLLDYCTVATHDVTTPLGVNLIHRLHHELAFDAVKPIMHQRHWLVASASMCKPLLTRVPIHWDPGFHSSNAPLAFGNLLLFHLAYFDLQTALRRQARRRATPRTPEDPAHHHKLADDKIFGFIEGWSRLLLEETSDLGQECPIRKEFIDRVSVSRRERENNTFKLDLNIWGTKLWHAPARFHDSF
jgi:Glycosyl transferase family 2